MSQAARYVVAIVVDPEFGDRATALLARMPVWMAETETNRITAERMRSTKTQPGQSSGHTAIGALTTFAVNRTAPPASWCVDVLSTVAGHHDRYSHSPGYSALEVYGVAPSPQLLAALADYGLTEITLLPEGFRAATSDGREARSPNDS